MQRAIVIAQHGAAQAHLFDRTLHSRNADSVADVVLVLEQDEEAVDEVMHQGLRAKTDGQTGDAGARQQRPQIQPQQRQHCQRRRQK